MLMSSLQCLFCASLPSKYVVLVNYLAAHFSRGSFCYQYVFQNLAEGRLGSTTTLSDEIFILRNSPKVFPHRWVRLGWARLL